MGMDIFITKLLLSLLILSVIPPVFSDRWHPHLNNASDQHALLGFVSEIVTYDPSQTLPSTWKPNVSFCHWTGVICSRRRQRVVSLNVSSMGLQGTITPLLTNLSFLRVLDLSNNSFYGHIPYHLGSLFRLKTLLLFRNHLQGSIPPTLSGCHTLQNLTLSYNNLTGNIPADLCVLSKLQFISLYLNNLTGAIPACLGNMSSLDYINLGSNLFHGNVPSELGILTHLSVVILSENLLIGQIPSSLSNCTSLRELHIIRNQLSGRIPELCSKNTQLRILYLSGNHLNGTIPASLFNCTKFYRIDLGYNQLSGVVPMEFAKLTQLEVLSLGENSLVSTNLPILIALTNCSNLRIIYLFRNNFMKRLPFSIGHLSRKLTNLNLQENDLIGKIPPQIGNLTNLARLVLYKNYFTGAIPSSLNLLQKLEVLDISNNNLQGNIHVEIGQFQTLGALDLSKNKLYGRIPDSIGGLQQLRYLYLSHNQLLGNIPENLGKCVNLLDLDLSFNRLAGKIPQEIGELANLALSFNLSNNLLHGPMPLALSKMTMLQAIDISANQLTGYIPSSLGSCKELEYLNLSYNAIEGMIPVTVGELQSLQDMDFSSNNLSGGIPMSLENLKMLRHVNFSFNKLSGEVPKRGVFKTLGAMAFIGNLGLCGPWVNLSPCSTHKHESVWHMKRVIIPSVAVAVLVVLFLFFGILWIQYHKTHNIRKVLASFIVEHRRISYAEMITATNQFSDANLLGVGNFGKVYKGILNDGTIVAIKLLNLENEGAHKSFYKECKVLGKVKHRNLIRIITSYSNLQMKALIFPLMPNGSLEKWLYPDDNEESGLNLFQRLNIAIDIAQGMAYLHHHCFMQVLHCDLKPSNVLLGEDMTAYLTDFGIASICFPNSDGPTLTSTQALKGSVGYIRPEYGLGGRVTTKGDVYSYGIVLLEMLTRKKPNHNMFVEGMTLQKWVGSSFPNQLKAVVDRSLLRMISTSTVEDKELNCLNQLVSVGLLCTKESPEGRPTMMDIVGKLQSVKEILLGVVRNTNFQSDITHLLGCPSTSHNINGEGQSSSTF